MLAPERAALIERRKTEFSLRWLSDSPDFMPSDGYCWSCRADLVKQIGQRYPVVFITCCPCCRRSFCD